MDIKKKAKVITFGCQQNVADSERIRGILCEMGYETDEKFDDFECSAIIFNTCAIREHAELKAFSKTGRVKAAKEQNRHLIVGLCGCIAEQEHRAEYIKKSFPYVDFILGTRSLQNLEETIRRCEETHKRKLTFESDEIIHEELPILRGSKFKANISVMYGCDNFCTYCVVPYVRGRERSRKRDIILKEAAGLIAGGYKEILYIGQNVNSYKDENDGEHYGFSDLLEDTANIEGDFLIRFITSHPKDVPDKLIRILGENEKMAKHIHLPVQSGSNEILSRMNRKYTREKYIEIVQKIKQSNSEIAVTSDIIVGFPGESESDFRETLELISECEFDSIFSFIYSKRKNTPAEKMEDKLPREEKVRRFEELIKLQDEISVRKNRMYEDKVIRVLVEGTADDREKLFGHTSSNKTVNFNGNPSMVGNFVNVKIKSGNQSVLSGELYLEGENLSK